ncbi:chloride channel protein [Limosilactobacillus sp.]|uniref:chloride channel protein n=1 Tax=Limosilactobacillus sp. TaxID=2773925 RepID=UPI003EFE9D5F
MKRYRLLATLYLLVAAIIIGVLTGLYLNTINFVIHLIWHPLPAELHLPSRWQIPVICLSFSLIIGLIQKYVGPYPLTIAKILDEVKVNGYFSYRNWWKILLAGLLILGAGASVGPEASASGLVAGMVYWFGCRYKLIHDQAIDYHTKPLGSQLRAITRTRFHPGDHPRAFKDYFPSKRRRQIFTWGWTLVGLVGFFGYFHFFPQEGVIGFHHPTIDWRWQGILVVIPALVVGWCFGYFFVRVSRLSEHWLSSPRWPIVKAFAGGALLTIAARFSHDVLFSGEFSIVPFAHRSLALSPLFLILLAVIKTVVTNAGFALGWRGGTIFPAIFSSLAVGAALAQAFPWMPRLTASLVVAAAITVILEKPLISAIILILLLPIQFSGFVLLACLLTSYLLKRYPKIKP